MASRQFNEWKDSNSRWVQLDIKYNPIAGGAGNPTNSVGDVKGSLTTITRTGAGLYTVVTKDPYFLSVGARVAVQSPTATLGFATVANIVKAANGIMTLTFKVYSPLGVLADANLTNGDAIFLQWVLQNTGRNQ